MNKLISKTPVLRFKEGRKIIKAEEGAVARWQRRIKSGINGIGNTFKEAFDMTFNPNNTLFGSLKIYNFVRTIPSRTINSLVVENYTPENGGTVNNRLRNRQLNNLNTTKKKSTNTSFKTSENGRLVVALPKKVDGKVVERGRLLNGKQVSYVPSNSLKKIEETSQTTAASSPEPKYWWVKGFRNRVQGLGLKSRDDVKAILRKLGVKADGIWGKNTEAAYVNKFKFSPNTSEEIIPMQEILPVSVISNVTPTFNTLNNPNFNWREALKLHYLSPFVTSAKQGGQLISKNPVESLNNINKN